MAKKRLRHFAQFRFIDPHWIGTAACGDHRSSLFVVHRDAEISQHGAYPADLTAGISSTTCLACREAYKTGQYDHSPVFYSFPDVSGD